MNLLRFGIAAAAILSVEVASCSGKGQMMNTFGSGAGGSSSSTSSSSSSGKVISTSGCRSDADCAAKGAQATCVFDDACLGAIACHNATNPKSCMQDVDCGDAGGAYCRECAAGNDGVCATCDAGAGACLPVAYTSCTKDGDCAGGFCVKSTCTPTLGTCNSCM
jgi:hypothetical protein